MKKTPILMGIISILLFAGCKGTPKEAHISWTPETKSEDRQFYFITDFKNKSLGMDIPPWVSLYDTGGIQMVEYLPEYQHTYLFVSKNRGANFHALEQWVSLFMISHDFPRLVSARIQDRFTHTSETYPDQEYGAFFEAVVKASTDAVYTGAVKEDDFWIKKQYFEEDGVTVSQEFYDFFILVSIDKELLKAQIDRILQNTQVGIPPTREQTGTINRFKETFYEGF